LRAPKSPPSGHRFDQPPSLNDYRKRRIAGPARASQNPSMKVHIRNIEAFCACGSCDFGAPPHSPPYHADETLMCAACGRKTRYGELLDQIGEEAMSQSNRALDSLKRACTSARNRRPV
jgi:hypothetical protein